MTVTPAYDDLVLAHANLQNFWKLGEGSGSILDSKGSVSGSVAGSGITRAAAGRGILAASIESDGSNGTYVDLGNNVNLDPTSAFTFECWVRPAAASANGRIFAKEKTSSVYSGHALALSAGKLYYFRNHGDGTDYKDFLGSTTLAQNVWTHIAVTYDSTTSPYVKLFVNGVDEGSLTVSGTLASPYSMRAIATSLTLFSPSDIHTTSQLGGRMMRVAIYNAALPAATLLAHYNAAFGVNVGDALGLLDSASAATSGPQARTINDSLGITEGDGKAFNELALATSGIDSLWKLNETSGSSLADSAGAVTGTKGSAVTLGGSELYPGAGAAPTFTDDSVNAVVNLGHNYKLANTENFSLEAWFRSTNLTPTNGSNHIIGAFDGTSGWRLVVLSTTRKLAFLRYDAAGNSDLIVGATTILANQTYLFGVSYDGTTVKLYVDGVLDGSGTSTRSVAASTTVLRIGAAGAATGSMVGRLGPIAKYSRALTAAEFARHFTPSGVPDVVTSTATAYARTISESLGLTDARAGSTSWTKTDTLGLTDAVSYEVGGRRDWVTISDSVVVTQTGSATNYTRTITDALGALDPRSRVHAATRSRDDTLGLSDAAGYQHLGNVAIRPFFAPLDVVAVSAPLDVVAVTAPLDLEVEI